jgi:hypothetical protein
MECARSWVKEGGVAPLRPGPGTMLLQATARGGQWRSIGLGTPEHDQYEVTTSMASTGWRLRGRASLGTMPFGQRGARASSWRGLGSWGECFLLDQE